jgi:hypothetical protein
VSGEFITALKTGLKQIKALVVDRQVALRAINDRPSGGVPTFLAPKHEFVIPVLYNKTAFTGNFVDKRVNYLCTI